MKKRIFEIVTTAVAALLVWLFLWPAQLGGNASYVVVSGPSMEPVYETGDLVVAREQSEYEVGDIVVYETEYGNVIHRIIGGDGETGYTMQGDNNSFVDQWQPTDDDIVGSAWLHAPNVGEYALITRQVALTPPMPYLIAGFVFLVIMLGGDKKKKGERPVLESGEEAGSDPDNEALDAELTASGATTTS